LRENALESFDRKLVNIRNMNQFTIVLDVPLSSGFGALKIEVSCRWQYITFY